MNLAAVARAALDRAPAEVKGTIVFTTSDGRTTSASCTAALARGTQADGFVAGTLISSSHRVVDVIPRGLDFSPEEGQTAAFEGSDWNVKAASPVIPSGADVTDCEPDDPRILLYRVTLSR